MKTAQPTLRFLNPWDWSREGVLHAQLLVAGLSAMHVHTGKLHAGFTRAGLLQVSVLAGQQDGGAQASRWI